MKSVAILEEHLLQSSDEFFFGRPDPGWKKERKRRVFIYRLFAPRYTQSAQEWITQFYLQTTPCLPFLPDRRPVT